jgi:two-component system sensor histidine kinase/response regulator
MSKILVIDDEASLRKMIHRALEQKGFEVIEAANSNEGFVQAHECLPDLILCDVNMDGTGVGFTTLTKLRENAATAAIPFILMTGMADAAGMRRGMELGADDYLAKPFKMEDLYATVNARLRKTRTVREEAEKKLALLRSQISVALPHEMRTPLSGILSNAELLATADGTLDQNAITEISQDIYQSAQRLEQLIENFLIYAQLEIIASDPHRTGTLRAARTPRAAEIARTAATAQAEKAGRQENLVLDLAETSLPMAEDYFKKIVAELVQNALKFSDPGTTVRVRLAMENGRIIFSVTDAGRGFSHEQIRRIGAYSQFDRKMQDDQGLGLGLAISKKLVEAHGGTLTIESGLGTGTTITLSLPAI